MDGRAARCQSPRSTYTRSKCLILTVKKPPCNRKRAQGPHSQPVLTQAGNERREGGNGSEVLARQTFCVMRGGLQREGVSQGKCNEQETGRRMGVHSLCRMFQCIVQLSTHLNMEAIFA